MKRLRIVQISTLWIIMWKSIYPSGYLTIYTTHSRFALALINFRSCYYTLNPFICTQNMSPKTTTVRLVFQSVSSRNPTFKRRLQIMIHLNLTTILKTRVSITRRGMKQVEETLTPHKDLSDRERILTPMQILIPNQTVHQ